MSFLEIVGTLTLLVLGAGLAWLLWEFGRAYVRGLRNTLMVVAYHRKHGHKVFLWRIPMSAWDLAFTDSVTFNATGHTMYFTKRAEPDDED